MYYFEKDYIMRLIHGIARILARMLFEKDLEEDGELAAVMEQDCAETYDYLRAMIDAGQINEAEEKLFDLLEAAAWERRQKAALILGFYDSLNKREDEELQAANFSREEIISGLEDAMRMIEMEIPEYLRIS